MNAADAETFSRCIQVGGVAVFPADTVYGLACEPDTRDAVERLYALKGRLPDKPAAVMFFDLELAFAAFPELGDRTRGCSRGCSPVPSPRCCPTRWGATRSPAGPISAPSGCGCPPSTRR